MTAGEWTRFSSSLSRLSTELHASAAAGVAGAALHVTRAVRASAVTTGAGRLGAVGYDVKGTSEPVALIKAKSRKAHFREHDTKTHSIAADPAKRKQQVARALQALFGQAKPRARRSSMKVRAGALSWQSASHPVRAVTHPGTKARPFFWPGVEAGLPGSADAFAAAVDRQVSEAWR